MTTQELLDAGYREDRPPQKPLSGCYSTALYQRRVRDEHGRTMYFLNVYYYEARPEINCPDPGYECEVTLYLGCRQPWITLEAHDLANKSIEWLERFVYLAFKNMNCVNDLHNNDHANA